MSTHTPGPWRAEGRDIRQGQENLIAQIARQVNNNGGGDPIRNANARLIAAAPRMLAELKDMYAAHVYGDHGRDISQGEAGCACDWYTETRAILRDVEGENNG